MIITSRERTTGMGARHFSAVPVGGDWTPLSAIPGRVYEGRDTGFEVYSLEVPPDAPWAEFHRSNSGIEQVRVYRGDHQTALYHSFERAGRELKSNR